MKRLVFIEPNYIVCAWHLNEFSGSFRLGKFFLGWRNALPPGSIVYGDTNLYDSFGEFVLQFDRFQLHLY